MNRKHFLTLTLSLLGACLLLASAALAEIVTLKDGRVIVAKKVIPSGGKVYVFTDKGKETFDEDQIASITPGDKAPTSGPASGKPPASAPVALPTAPAKEALATPAPGTRETVVENLETLYRLEKYDELAAAAGGAIPPAAKVKVKLLTAKAYCRLGKFTEAEKLYEELSAQGPPADKAYAKACADVLRANPDGAYKGAAGLSAAELMKSSAAKDNKTGSAAPAADATLKNEKVFDSALRAYALQYLKDGEPLMVKLKAAWKPELTGADFEKCGGGKAVLRYEGDKKKLVALYDQADAASPGVSASVRKELVRLEAEHLESVLAMLAEKIEDLGPGGSKLYENRDKKLTIKAQNQWKEQTDKALVAAKIALSAANYLVNLYKQNEADFGPKIKEAEGKKSTIEGLITGLLKDRNRTTLD